MYLEKVYVYVCMLSGPLSILRHSHTVVVPCTYTDDRSVSQKLFSVIFHRALPIVLVIVT
jgi:hypothetical protein